MVHVSADVAQMLGICQSIPGWMDPLELEWIFRRASEVPAGGIWVELGLWNGRSFLAAGLGLRGGCELWGVDHFKGSPQDHPDEGADLASSFLRNLHLLQSMRPDLQCNVIVADSAEAAARFPAASVHTVFIDACHEYESVRSDVTAWMPRVVADGTLCGHDYNRCYWPGVTRGVVELLPGVESGPCSIWHWSKTEVTCVKSPKPTLSIVISTIGRPSLRDTLKSIREQELIDGDEVVVVHDGPASGPAERMWNASGLPGRFITLRDGPHKDWGAAARTTGQEVAIASHFLWQDDDDTYLPGAFRIIRRECAQAPDAFLLFRMAFPNGWLMWQRPHVACGNVSTQIFAAPRTASLGVWGVQYNGDFQFIHSSIQANPNMSVRFVDRPIVMYSRPH